MPDKHDKRVDRMQIVVSDADRRALDDFRFAKRLPSRASAVRELLRRGLAAEGYFDQANSDERSGSFGILDPDQ